MTIVGRNNTNTEGMTKIWKERQKSGRNDSNTEGMTIIRKERHKKNFLAQIFLQLALLPLQGHEEAIGTLGYPIASKLED